MRYLPLTILISRPFPEAATARAWQQDYHPPLFSSSLATKGCGLTIRLYHPPLFSSSLATKGCGGKQLMASSCSGVLSAVFRRMGFPPSLMRNVSIERS